MRTAVATAAVAAVATAGLLAGCGDGTGGAAREAASPSGLAPPTSAAPGPQTVTATVTEPPTTVTAPTATDVPPPVPTTSAAPPTSAPPPAPASSSAGAVGVLNAYFDAVNARDYARAWELGGRVFASTYAQFVDNHATKAHYDLTVLSVDGGVVTAAMDVTQTDGSHRYYAGTYIVADGTISGTTMREVSNSGAPVPSSGATTTPPTQGPQYFERCAEAWAAGEAPIERGEPGYRDELDRDKDGTACEPSPEGVPSTTSAPPE